MDVLASLLAVAAVMLVVAYIIQPFLAPGERRSGGSGGAASLRQRADLLAERNRLYRLIRELDFDYKTGKFSDEDYAGQRYRLVAQGVDILQQIDALPPEPDPADDPIERVVLALREGRPAALVEAAPAAARFCPQCGSPTRPGDRFCAVCGASLS